MIDNYIAKLADGTKYPIFLGEIIHRGGAAGLIRMNLAEEKSVAKIFHDKSKSEYYAKKIEAMLKNKPEFPPALNDGNEYVQVAWPEALIEDENGRCVGYLMPLINMENAVSLDHLMQKAVRKRLELNDSYSHRLFAAYNVASMVNALHLRGHYMIDLKPANIHVYKDNMMVAMVDCDGFSIGGAFNERFPAEFVSEEYIYPEGMDLSVAEMGIEQDKFALSCVIFKLLNNGIHPYSGTPRLKRSYVGTIQERIENKLYAYGRKECKEQKPNPYSIHEYFDDETRVLFERAFLTDNNRPNAKEWCTHLWTLLNEVKTCKNNPNHAYFKNKECGLCKTEEKFEDNISHLQTSKMKQFETKRYNPEKQDEIVKKEPITKDNIGDLTMAEFLSSNEVRKAAFWGSSIIYLIFLINFKSIISPIVEKVKVLGFGFQAIFAILLIIALHTGFKYISKVKISYLYKYLFGIGILFIIYGVFSDSLIAGELFRLAD